MRGKYVVYSHFGEQVILLSEGASHETAGGVGHPLISAGFFSVDSIGQVSCSGESKSLHLKTRGHKDATLVKSIFQITQRG